MIECVEVTADSSADQHEDLIVLFMQQLDREGLYVEEEHVEAGLEHALAHDSGSHFFVLYEAEKAIAVCLFAK